MISATLTGMITVRYEDQISAIPLLVAFMPMLMDTGGNCGSQSSTLIIRGMALEEIRLRDFFKVVFKELRISVLCSIVLAIVNGIRIYIQYQKIGISLVVSLSLICTVIIATIMGGILPMLAKRFKLDPAIMAAPLITTIVDTCSVMIYFNIAMKILDFTK
jgi:magnesium transporter